VSGEAPSKAGRAVAAVLGIAFLVSALSGRADVLVRPWFTWVLIATGLALIAVAVWSPPAISAGATFALLLPVAVGLGLTPRVVGRVSNGEVGTASLSQRFGDSSNPLLSGKGGNVTLLEIRVAEQQVGAVYLSGRRVTTEAKVSGDRELSRSVIVCCAADARTLKLTEAGAPLPDSGTWVRVSGRLAASKSGVVLVASKVAPIGVPSEPFL
jgi:hypothetical protein